MPFSRFSRKGAACLLLLAMLFALFSVPMRVRAEEPAASWSFEELNAYSKYFSNHVDGYRLMVQNTMEADMSLSAVRAVLRDEKYTIEIYDQTLDGSGVDGYASYSSSLLQDSAAYHVTFSGEMTLAGYRAIVLEWNRPLLSRVAGDKCYYASVDLELEDNRALSFLFKSTAPFDQFGSKYYALVVNTLTLIPQTASGIVTATLASENSHWNAETRQLYWDWFGEEAPLRWGIFKPNVLRTTWDTLTSLEERLDYQFPVILDYAWNLDSVETLLPKAAKEQRTVELTLQPPLTPPADGTNIVLNTLNGKYDDYFKGYAQRVASSGKPVLFRLCNEMNGDWCQYSALNTCRDAELFVLFYRYVYHIFEENGALKNTIWIWNPNCISYPGYDWNHALCYYPGDEYVDVVGLTGYNTGTYYYDIGERWLGFHEIYDSLYADYCSWFGQPLMITEFSCSSFGGDKLAWVEEMLQDISGFPRIKVAIWWDGVDLDANGNAARPYYIDDVEGLPELFRDYFAGLSLLQRTAQEGEQGISTETAAGFPVEYGR